MNLELPGRGPEKSPRESSPEQLATHQSRELSLKERAEAVDFKTRLVSEQKLTQTFKDALDLLGVEDGKGNALSLSSPIEVNTRLQEIFWKGAEDDNALKIKGGKVDFSELFVAELNQLYKGQEVTDPNKLIQILDELDMLHDLGPVLHRVDTAVILGATAPAIVHRTDYLASKIQEGSFDAGEVVFTGGERKVLQSDINWIENFYTENFGAEEPVPWKLPFIRKDSTQEDGQRMRFNEALFAKWYVDNHSPNCPESWKGKEGIAQPASPLIEEGGKITTISTAVAMKSLFPKPNPIDVAIVSSQPHGPRQGADMLCTLLMPSGDTPGWAIKSYDVLAPATKNAKPPTVLLKELAGQLNRECQLTGLL